LRDSVKSEYVNLLVQLGQKLQVHNYLADSVDIFRKAINIEPLSEAAHEGLIKTFALQGSRSQAIRQFSVYENLIESELNLKPPKDLIEMISKIKENKYISLNVSYPDNRQIKKIRKTAFEKRILIGRETELNYFLSFLEDVNNNLLMVEGDAGIGKSRFIYEAASLAEEKGFVSYISEIEEDGSILFNHFLKLFEQIIQNNPKEIIRDIPDEFAILQSQTLDFEKNKKAIASDKLAAREYLFADCLNFFIALAKANPVLIIFDDFHFSDDNSQKLLNYLIIHLQGKNIPIYFVLSINLQFNNKIQKFISELKNSISIKKILLKPLTYSDYSLLTEQVLRYGELENSLSREIYSCTEGHPLFTIEVLEQLLKSGEVRHENGIWKPAQLYLEKGKKIYIPPSFQILFVKKWNALSLQAQNILSIAAVGGQFLHLELLELLLNIPREYFLDSIDELVSSGIFKESGFNYSFTHSLFRHSSYQQISQARLKELHSKTASALEAIHAKGLTIPAESIALHYKSAGNIKKAVKYLMKTASKAISIYAHDDAILKLKEAHNLLEQNSQIENYSSDLAEIHEQLGRVYKAIGNIDEAKQYFSKAIDFIKINKESTVKLNELYKEMAISSILTTDMENARKYLTFYSEASGKNALGRARSLIIESLFLWHFNELEKAVEKSKEALELAEENNAEIETNQACEMLALSLFPLGKWKEGLKYELKRELAGWSPDIVVATDGHLCLWEYHLHGNESYESAVNFLNDVYTQADQLGDLRCLAICHYALGSIDYLRGNFQEAIKNLQKARVLQFKIKSPAQEAYTLARLTQLHTVQGNLEAGWKSVQEGMEISGILSVKDHVLQRLYAAGLMNRLKAADNKNADKLITDINILISSGKFCPSCSVQMFLAASYYYLFKNEFDKATEFADKAKVFIDMTKNIPLEALLMKLKGEIFLHQKKYTEAEKALLYAKDVFSRLGQEVDLMEVEGHIKEFSSLI
jgi:tetratricopeptide (TPR) repeat protein